LVGLGGGMRDDVIAKHSGMHHVCCDRGVLQRMESMDMISFPGRSYRYATDGVLFPFGYGLSYTTFQYNRLAISPPTATFAHPSFAVASNVTIDITNTGKM
jgi:beta-glucosidase